MRFASVCSGIEAASVAWNPLGWQCEFVSEIEPFPCAVLKQRYPQVPNFGDITRFREWPHATFDLLAGGTPCQSFSVAGLRTGLDDPRGNLALIYLAILERFAPTWAVWENVRGVLSSNSGRDFGAFIGALARLGYGFAWRVLDAQHFGVAQRRRRVFLIAHRGGWRSPAAVLFDAESLHGNCSPQRTQGEDASKPSIGDSLPCWWDGGQVAQTLDAVLAKGQAMPEKNRFPAVLVRETDGTIGLRRITPREAERLQGFPDDWTLIPGAKDGPRYRAIGNSMAVPVMRWIGERIAMVEAATRAIEPARLVG